MRFQGSVLEIVTGVSKGTGCMVIPGAVVARDCWVNCSKTNGLKELSRVMDEERA